MLRSRPLSIATALARPHPSPDAEAPAPSSAGSRDARPQAQRTNRSGRSPQPAQAPPGLEANQPLGGGTCGARLSHLRVSAGSELERGGVDLLEIVADLLHPLPVVSGRSGSQLSDAASPLAAADPDQPFCLTSPCRLRAPRAPRPRRPCSGRKSQPVAAPGLRRSARGPTGRSRRETGEPPSRRAAARGPAVGQEFWPQCVRQLVAGDGPPCSMARQAKTSSALIPGGEPGSGPTLISLDRWFPSTAILAPPFLSIGASSRAGEARRRSHCVLDAKRLRPARKTRTDNIESRPPGAQMSTAVAQESAPPTHAEVELRHELAVAFHDLRSAASAFALHGGLHDKRLAPRVQRIYELDAQLAPMHARRRLLNGSRPRCGQVAWTSPPEWRTEGMESRAVSRRSVRAEAELLQSIRSQEARAPTMPVLPPARRAGATGLSRRLDRIRVRGLKAPLSQRRRNSHARPSARLPLCACDSLHAGGAG